jgi:hypothetical protein
MWTIYSVALILKQLGYTCMTVWTTLKLYWWPPPSHARTKEKGRKQANSKPGRKKMLLTALAIAALKCDSLVRLPLTQDQKLRRRIRSASRKRSIEYI